MFMSNSQEDNKILVCTIASYSNSPPLGFDILKKSCKIYDISLTVWGENVKFISNYESKLKYLYYKLVEVKDKYKYVLWVDAVDTIFATNIEEIFNKYLSFNSKLVIR